MYVNYNNSRNQEQCKINNDFDIKNLGGQRHAHIESGYVKFCKLKKKGKKYWV